MKTINPKYTFEATEILNQFWINTKNDGLATNRTYDSLFRMTVAQARLNLSDVIDEEIVTQVMNSLSLMWSQYGKVAKVIMNPKELTYQVFYQVLKVTKSGMTIYELCDSSFTEYSVAVDTGRVYCIRYYYYRPDEIDV